MGSLPLHPEIPEEGMTLQELFKGRIDLESVKARLMRVAREEGLPFGPRDMTYSSRLAQELGKWAESEGRGKAYHDAVFRAYFAEAGTSESDLNSWPCRCTESTRRGSSEGP